jgi:hypothetical protein
LDLALLARAKRSVIAGLQSPLQNAVLGQRKNLVSNGLPTSLDTIEQVVWKSVLGHDGPFLVAAAIVTPPLLILNLVARDCHGFVED